MDDVQKRVALYDDAAGHFGRLFYTASALASAPGELSPITLRKMGVELAHHLKEVWRILGYDEKDLEEARMSASLDSVHGLAPNWNVDGTQRDEGY
jgi:hypothetical protein